VGKRERCVSPQAHRAILATPHAARTHTHTRTRSRTRHTLAHSAGPPARRRHAQTAHGRHIDSTATAATCHTGCLSRQDCRIPTLEVEGWSACQPQEAGQSWVPQQGGGRAGAAGWTMLECIPEVPRWPGQLLSCCCLSRRARAPLLPGGLHAEGLMSDGVSASRAPEGAGLAALGAAGEFVRTGSMLPKAFFAVSWFSASRAWRCCPSLHTLRSPHETRE